MIKKLFLSLLFATPCYAQTTPVARWHMDEATGAATLVDSVNGYNATVTSGTLDQATGIIGSWSQDFEAADTKYAEAADTANLSAGNVKFGGTCWYRPETTSGVIAMKGWQSAADVNREWVLYMASGTAVRFTMEKADGTGTIDLTNSNVSMAAGQWYFLAWWYDPVTDLMNLKVNKAPTQTIANTTGTYDGNRTFVIGASPGQALYTDGAIDDFRWYKTNYPTEAELTDLYNEWVREQYTEFYCNASTGSNMNGGSEEATSPSYSTTNGNWNATTGVFTPTSGDPSASVTVGEYANVFNDGATTPVFIGRVTAVSSTTITVSLIRASGAPPTTSVTARSINVGGVWKGPNGTDGFPFNLLTQAIRREDNTCARVNFKNNATYDVTAQITSATTGDPLVFEGYTTTPGDGGEAKIDGGGSGVRYILFQCNNALGAAYKHLWFTRNGGTGSTQNMVSTNNGPLFIKCRFSHSSFTGVTGGYHIGCESYSNNGMGFATPLSVIRCKAHNNTQYGFDLTNASNLTIINCIAHNNTSVGFYFRATAARCVLAKSLDAYENGGDGIRVQRESAFLLVLEDCNTIKNSGYGIGLQGSIKTCSLILRNVGFGAGTAADTLGEIQAADLILSEDAIFRYPDNETPWVDPENGDFSVNHADAKGAGHGDFLELSGLYSGGTVGYPDIGAAQHEETPPPPAWLNFELCD